MKRLLSFTFYLLSFTLSFAQGELLVADSAIITGRLDNGITYYLRHNTMPKGHASFYLVRNAGAILENDSQNGLAHFLEHMAFKGTKHFPGNALVETLERGGVPFASGVNAYTGQDETVYNISGAPTKSEGFVDTCLLILHDWSYYLSLDEAAIDEERKVISEEWRRKQTPVARVHKQTLPYTFKGSPYAVRDVIGDLDIIQNFEPALLRDFYHKWYRSDLEAIIIVGDLDMKRMEQKIQALFSTIPAVKNPESRPIVEIPDFKGTDYVLATDPEIGRSSLGLAFRHRDSVSTASVDYIKENLMLTLCNSMIARRLKERQTMGADSAVLRLSMAYTPLVRNYSVYNLSVTPKDNEAAAWRTMLTENERLLRHGFTADELQHVKKNMFESLENTLLHQGGAAPNETYVADIQSWFLTGKPAITFRPYYNHAKPLLESITLEELNAKFRSWNSEDNRLIVITGKSGVKHLSEAEALRIEAEVKADQSIRPYVPAKIEKKPLLKEKPQGGKIVSERELPTFKAREWILDNGAKVIFRRAAYDRGSIQVASYSPGGTSLYDLDMLPAAENASRLVKSFGLADHTPVELGKILEGKRVRTNVTISDCSESVGGSAAPQDLETLFQLLYLHFEKPRFDARLFGETMSRSYASLATASYNPQQAMSDSINQIVNGYHPRILPYDSVYLDGITLPRLEQVYRERFSDAADFTFFIVGDIAEQKVKKLSEQYLGALSSKGVKEQPIDHKTYLPKGHTVRTLQLPMQNAIATVVSLAAANLPYTAKNNVCGSVLQVLLQNRYTDCIRHRAGGTYDVSVRVSSVSQPAPRYTAYTSFNCDPLRAEELQALLQAETQRFLKEGPTAEELQTVVKYIQDNVAQTRSRNAYWMNVIASYTMDGIDLTLPENFDDILAKLKPADLKKFAKKLWKGSATLDLLVKPE